MRKAMAVLAIGVLLAVAACSDDGDGKAATGPTEQVANKKDTTTTEPKDVTNAAALAMKGSNEIDPSPDDPLLPGAVRKTYEVGPIEVKPGQNNIAYQGGQVPKPEVSGWIVRIAPNLRREDGTVPPVDVIHLHHGVWLNMSRKDMTRPGLPERFFAAGEEKTIFTAPDGYGYPYKTTDKWLINYMLHNLWPKGEKIWITYTLDFIPDTAPQAADIQAATPLWMDVENGSTYPVFDVLKGTGEDGRFTYPDDADDPYGDDPPDNSFTVPADGTLVATGGHLHPGGLQTDL